MLILDKIMLYKVMYKRRVICYNLAIKGCGATNTTKLKGGKLWQNKLD